MKLKDSSVLQIETKELAHYGLIYAVIKRLKLTERLRDALPKKNRHHQIDHAEAVIAMIFNMLGQGSGRFYTAKSFFSNFPIKNFFGRSIKAISFNASTLARTLDTIADIGPDMFFLNTAFKIAVDEKLLAKELHLDTTSISFHGSFKKDAKKRNLSSKNLRITYGHSKAKRPDMIQVVLSMITGGKSGIPYWINTHSGNQNDKDLFKSIIKRMTAYLNKHVPLKATYFVADSCLYSRDYLLNQSHHTKWITRVPESVRMAKDILEQGHKGVGWTKMKNNVKYKTFYSEYAGIKQRWIIVHSHRAFYKEQLTFKNRLDERSEQLYLLHKKFRSRLYKNEDEARDEASQLKRRFPYHKIKSKIVPVYNGFLDVGKDELALQGYRIEIEYVKDFLKIDRAINRKGKYIIATNIPEAEKTDNQIYAAYQRRNANIESCFRQVKSFQFIGKGIYFKNIKRIQALMSVVALALFVNNVGQLILRKGLNSTKQKVFNFAGKKIKNPTFAMIGKLMRRVSMITIKHKSGTYSRVLDLSDDLRKVVNLFGPQAQMAYGFT